MAGYAGSCTIWFTIDSREPGVPLHPEVFVLDTQKMWPGVHL